MKKTITLLLAVSALASVSHAATVFTYQTEQTGSTGVAQVYGFQLSLSSGVLSPSNSDSPPSLTGDVQLNQLTIAGRTGYGSNVTYGLLVLNLADNTVIGKSTNTGTAVNNPTFTFSATDGASPLILDASSTYRFLAVTEDTLKLVTGGSGVTYLYNAGGENAVTSSQENNTVTISQGLARPGVTVQTNGKADDKCNFISSTDGQSIVNWNPILTGIEVTQVPEPAAASLSLIGLAALMMRRRRV
ncbi:PEP-CTERM sorting domain-containing protein [Akkermansia sp.]|uniref:PEP-CTERM sorting domain-containing protein n=1 Tax=Akkermansia sp. TaxID=1872421 RepID=UPI0025C28C56|nr:PEP-CTERM sorting domain-containing protein [Akkermansia sp.]MCC8147644.1 PEP-CTERM sorting domain-containing protein [Akkermansia sp.]